LREAALQLCALDDTDSWQWSRLEAELTRLAADATIDGCPVDRPVVPRQMAALLAARLGGRPGRPRFGSGAITLSSLTAQRGVPHRVVCLLGFDAELGGGAVSADDFTAILPCVGDRDARSEGRAQLLDAVLSAGEHLIICSTGRDLRTNAEVPPAVALAEFADLIDASALAPLSGPGVSATRASDAIAVAHPRQAWSERNFIAGELGVDGPWGFDAAARTAAIHRRVQTDAAPLLPAPLPLDRADECDLAGLHLALTEPARRLLSVRLGVAVAAEATEPDDAIALSLDGLEHWQLADALLTIRLTTPPEQVDDEIERWVAIERARGALPPVGFGAQAVDSARSRADGIATTRNEVLATEAVATTPTTVPVEYVLADGRPVRGEITGVHGHLVVTAAVSTLAPKHRLAAWLRLALLTCAAPEVAWQALLVGTTGTGDNRKPRAERFALRAPADAAEVLDTVVDLFDRSGADLIAFFPATSEALQRGDRSAALKAWRPDSDQARGESDDRWVQFAFGVLDLDDLLRQPPRADESGEPWGEGSSRVERWAERVWGAYHRTTVLIGADDA
jgi:exodeoxyribonuclease V gamma subunit